ncbi:hypothetical protein CC1G_04978 [Coprinopsis cinerea okayama7|uniref:Septin-type G domain-containing protein n=1 Tax=Coprinopsis cinerea (strain Okayama-7 / 130 / ATCC MYA-4618 / FGSC 9003) TaxID=240176 RepID=A8NSD3_COPC7|nr:hypothetical protein CC1G_04978 [Coprinopsis cinerea okayama7\|eukprot:XP_001835985.2 hypothetical protein CC1G_04978 [Coprinopsis cinerea okayama7\
MFSFRRKPKKDPQPTVIRTSPSLPELNSQGIPWPEDLVDISAIRESSPPPPSSDDHHPVLGNPQESGGISALYMTPGGPPTFEPKKAHSLSSSTKYSQRRARVPPTFNLMVVGGKGTGKTSLLRLLLDTADISPTATVDQKAALDKFLKGSTRATQAIQTACIEICESRFDRVLFSVIDTPGLDFQEGRELKLERQVSSVIKYIDQQYADTMSEESKVVRQNKGDQHIHLCIYMIDPSSIMSAEDRSSHTTFQTIGKTRSETTISQSQPPDLVPDTSSESESEDEEQLTMSPAELRVIRRISAKANVLPVIAHADSLTDEKLQAVKKAVRNGLAEAGIDLGVFAPEEIKEPSTPKRKTRTKFSSPNGNGSANGHEAEPSIEGVNGDAADNSVVEDESPADDDERTPRPIIKLRPKRHGRPLSRSRSRRDLSRVAEDDDRRPSSPDLESVANVRFSAHIVAKVDVTEMLPFALIAPEPGKRRPRPISTTSTAASVSERGTSPSHEQQQSEDGATSPDGNVPPTPASTYSGKNFAYLNVPPPEDLKGVFVRNYRWGTVDVLNPDHCDFAAMRTAVMSTHFKLLKIRTKEVLYEKYRTEKLLARRATAQISEEQRQRLLEDLGL